MYIKISRLERSSSCVIKKLTFVVIVPSWFLSKTVKASLKVASSCVVILHQRNLPLPKPKWNSGRVSNGLWMLKTLEWISAKRPNLNFHKKHLWSEWLQDLLPIRLTESCHLKMQSQMKIWSLILSQKSYFLTFPEMQFSIIFSRRSYFDK